MSKLYGETHRRLQREFDTERLADRIEQRLFHEHISPEDQAFIEGMDMFFLATADKAGRPNCSYKGGDPGFVRVLDPQTLVFPNYDGNGMYISMGNTLENPEVGMLFLDFENRKRLRLNGTARIEPANSISPALRRGPVHCESSCAPGVSELPALYSQTAVGGALQICPACCRNNPGARLEANRLVLRCASGK